MISRPRTHKVVVLIAAYVVLACVAVGRLDELLATLPSSQTLWRRSCRSYPANCGPTLTRWLISLRSCAMLQRSGDAAQDRRRGL